MRLVYEAKPISIFRSASAAGTILWKSPSRRNLTGLAYQLVRGPARRESSTWRCGSRVRASRYPGPLTSEDVHRVTSMPGRGTVWRSSLPPLREGGRLPAQCGPDQDHADGDQPPARSAGARRGIRRDARGEYINYATQKWRIQHKKRYAISNKSTKC